MSELVHEGNLFILYIPIGFTVPIIAEINSLLDIVESHEGPTALIITSKNPKIFSAGMDLKEILRQGGSAEAAARVFISLMKLYGRLLAFKVPTIGALNGHTIAGGLMLSLSLDYRIMASGKFMMKMTELPLGMVLPRGGDIVLTAKLAANVHRDLVLRGKSFSCEEGLASGIIDELVEKKDLMRRARELANELAVLGDKKDVYMCVKKSMYHDSIEVNQEAKYSRAEWKAMGEEEPKL